MNAAAGAHRVCPHCGQVNRAPDSRAGGARCGACRNPLFSGDPSAVDLARLERFVSRDQRPVLVDFWASWCAPCRMMAPQFASAASELEPAMRLLKLDTEANPDAGARFGIRGIPTMILFDHGREIARQSGAMSTGDIVAWARRAAR
ncbi:Thioredoxin [Thioalkalivibrio nitratireducens DSM 14787]|uniref:Thioredoxin n=1 Tax=Thioalkalivibrio nitratireducens (strain DSM 14787 / UNIQEM 213 / ALEN2) TaxID=1255043 RepID=L0E0L8_THIND|nr:thioredoxin domain-containing protein [Thioalkalivibrio nitratireducens]AGA35359.1 Thioredoxin [Thioalkalivibrio nitratireducens DSM 14787]